MNRKLTFLDWYSIIWIGMCVMINFIDAVTSIDSTDISSSFFAAILYLPVMVFIYNHTFGDKQ